MAEGSNFRWSIHTPRTVPCNTTYHAHHVHVCTLQVRAKEGGRSSTGASLVCLMDHVKELGHSACREAVQEVIETSRLDGDAGQVERVSPHQGADVLLPLLVVAMVAVAVVACVRLGRGVCRPRRRTL